MKMNILITALLSLLLVACSSTETILVGGKKTEVPDWVLAPDKSSERAGIFYGVGSSKIDDVDMARYTADQLATRNLIKGIDQRQKNRSTHSTVAQGDSGGREDAVTTKFESQGIIQGVRIVKRYVTKDGTWYSKAMLDLNRPDANFESELKKPQQKTTLAQ